MLNGLHWHLLSANHLIIASSSAYGPNRTLLLGQASVLLSGGLEINRQGGEQHVSTNRVIRHELFSATTLSSRFEASGFFPSSFPSVCSDESAGRRALLYQYPRADFELCSTLLRTRERILLARRLGPADP